MINYAPVVPPNVEALNRLPSTAMNLAGFCFANQAVYDDAYREWFLAAKLPVILDCPIYEGGAILGPELFGELIKAMSPVLEFAIIPDHMTDYHETMRLFAEYTARIDHPNLTGVVQGDTVEQALECAYGMLSYGIRRLALPVRRKWAAQMTRDEFVMNYSWPALLRWHFLGADYPYRDAFHASWLLPSVLSVDTAEPVNAAIRATPIFNSTVKRPDGFMKIQGEEIPAEWLRANVSWMASWLAAAPVAVTESPETDQRTQMFSSSAPLQDKTSGSKLESPLQDQTAAS